MTVKLYLKTNLVKNLQLKYPGSFKYLITIYGITKRVLSKIMEIVRGKRFKYFLEEAEKEKKELAECYEEAKRQTAERKKREKTISEKSQEELEPITIITSPMSDE